MQSPSQKAHFAVTAAPLPAFFTLAAALMLALLVLLIAPQAAHAEPTTNRAESIIHEINLGESHFRLITDRPAIPTDGAYSYIVEITPGTDLVSVNLHFQLMREENGWPFHYFGDSIYIDRPAPAEDAEQDAAAANNHIGANEEAIEDTGQVTTATTAAGTGTAGTGTDTEPEVIRHILQRRSADNLVGLGMREGIYYVAVIVTATTDTGAESATLQDLLVVYDPEKPQLNLMPTVHLSALPARDARGVFLSNPQTGVFEKRRAMLEQLADWINTNQRASLTLALSPLFLEELNAVSLGYDYLAPAAPPDNAEATATAYYHSSDYGADDDTATVTAESEAAQTAVRTIDALRTALGTGRLTLTTQGYADPNITVLDSLGLLDDFAAHIDLGQQVTSAVLNTETPPIIVPWTNQLSEASLGALQEALPNPRIIIDSNLAEHGGPNYAFDLGADTDADSDGAAFTVKASFEDSEILIADADLSAALSSDGSRAAFIQQLLELREDTSVKPILFQASDDMSGLAVLIENLELLSRYNWLALRPGDTPLHTAPDAPATPAATAASFSPAIRSGETSVATATAELAEVRSSLAGLEGALMEPSIEDLEVLSAYNRASLASFAGPGVAVSAVRNNLSLLAAAPECLVLARGAQGYVDSWFEGLSINTQPITFSGASGVLPITVHNASGHSFVLDVRYRTPGPNVMIYPEYVSQAFAAGESFLEPTVELRNIVSGSVDIRLMAGDHLIAEESVRVSATYADRIAIIVLVALAGTGLAFYVWRRVQKSESAGDAPEENR